MTNDPHSTSPFVSVVVPHYADLQRLDLCLDALRDQTYPKDRYEIIVADNASPQGEAAVTALVAGRARVVTVREAGAGPARNGGAAVATGEILAFTDADCLPAGEWLEQGVAALGDADLIGGRVLVTTGDPGRPTAAEAFELVFAFDNARYVRKEGFSVSANLLCWTRVFSKVGGFRVGVPEDLDWCVRARALGFALRYADKAVVSHPARRTWPELTGKWRRLTAEAYGLTGQGAGGRLRWRLRALLLPASALAHTPKVLGSRQLHGWSSKADALAVLYRLRLWRMREALSLSWGSRP